MQLSEALIENAIKARIGNASLGIAIAWPNKSFPAKRPYYEVSFLDSSRSGGALKGGATIEKIEGTLAVIVVVDNDGHTTVANEYADEIVAIFPEGERIQITNGEVCFRLPNIKKGFEANGQWRTPVIIPYYAYKT